MSEMASPSHSEKHYPSLYLDWDSDYKFPESGTMVIKFNKSSENNRKNKGGKTHQSVTLEVTSIEKVSGGKAKPSKEEDTGDHLDRLKKEVESEKEESDEGYQEE